MKSLQATKADKRRKGCANSKFNSMKMQPFQQLSYRPLPEDPGFTVSSSIMQNHRPVSRCSTNLCSAMPEIALTMPCAIFPSQVHDSVAHCEIVPWVIKWEILAWNAHVVVRPPHPAQLREGSTDSVSLWCQILPKQEKLLVTWPKLSSATSGWQLIMQLVKENACGAARISFES